MMHKTILIAAALPLLAGGCVASTVWSVATLPVKAATKTYDLATTSQDESDRNYGRKMRKEEEKRGRAERDAEKRAKQDKHDRD